MKGLKVGYIRVSSIQQNTWRQLEGIQLDKVFTDKMSGKDTKRDEYQMMLSFIREGDSLYVHSMDRLARNLDDLRNIVSTFVKRGIVVHFVKENLVFNGNDSAMSLFTLSIMGAFAEFERSMIRERQREGIEAGKNKGVYKGRGKVLNKLQIDELLQRVKDGQSKASIAKYFNLSESSIHKYLKREKIKMESHNVISH